MTAFYRDALGLAPLPERAQPGWVELDAGGVTVALHAIPEAIAASIAVGDPPLARESAPIKLVFAVDDVAAARARLAASGAVMGDVRSWGACDGVDPEGNVFQIAAAGTR